ncbi:MAG TPA: hypothetical protein VNH38_03265 [Candidatus Dormibacteraeota bacterium]|nr:hypothetical protein [Candidatus Dormibacteraeota bacterium]
MTDRDHLAILAEPIPVPTHVDLSEDGKWIRWDRFHEGPPESRRLGFQALAGFLALRDPAAGPERIRDYARQWGVLAICRHGFPTSHAHNGDLGPDSPVFPEHTGCLPFRAYEEPHYLDARRRLAAEGRGIISHGLVLTGMEPIAYWQATATAFWAALQLARQLRAAQLGRREDWRLVYEWPPGRAVPIRFGQWEAPQPPPADPLPLPGSWSPGLWMERAEEHRELEKARGTWNPPEEAPNTDAGWTIWLRDGMRRTRAIVDGLESGDVATTPAGQQTALAAFVDRWLELGAVRPVFQWTDQGPRLSFNAGGLFGALAVHLAVRVMNAQGWATCSGCGAPYAPWRQEPVGRRTYCDGCRKKRVPVRDAARDYRAREHAKATGVAL